MDTLQGRSSGKCVKKKKYDDGQLCSDAMGNVPVHSTLTKRSCDIRLKSNRLGERHDQRRGQSAPPTCDLQSAMLVSVVFFPPVKKGVIL